MPKVVMLVSMAASNWSLMPGDVAEVNEETADAWQEHRIAIPYVQEEVKIVDYNTEIPLSPEEITDSIDSIDLVNPPGNMASDPSIADEITHVGGGWYLLPNGEKVQGKEEAQEALKELQGSDE
jgi:hypothetical protein